MGKSVRVGFAFLFGVVIVAAQQTATTPAPAPTTPTAPPAPTAPVSGGRTSSGPISTQPSQTQQPAQPPPPIFISGNVLLADGTEPPDRVLIERLCSTNSVRSEGYTDSKGRFSLQLGQSQQLIPDASTIMLLDGTQGLSSSNTRTSNGNQTNTDPLFDCELRARLAGYRSSSILLAGHKTMDNPGIGTLILSPIVKTEGQAVSATSAAASKDARKAFEKGVSEFKKQKLDSAEKEFRKAAELHPKYADAWLELGKTYVALNRLPEAREALTKAIAADPQYVYPHEQMYLVAFQETNWQELADTTDRLLRLNPYEFPDAYYFNGVANYQLKKFDAAQKSLQQAIDYDRRRKSPKAFYVLGLVLIQKHDYQGAAENLVTFANLSPNDPLISKVQAILDEIERASH